MKRRARSRAAAGLVAALCTAVSGAVSAAAPAHADPVGQVNEFPVPTASSAPFWITQGPDGNLWFTETNTNKIATVTPAGVITEFTIPTGAASPQGITTGPDGNLWFTEGSANKVAKVTTSGTFTEYTLPTASSGPFSISAGPDGNLWFTESSANKVAKITTSGVVTEYTIPTASSFARVIVAGPDGNLWFTESSTNKIAKVTTAGAFSEYTVTTAASGPWGITNGPDGNLWFTERDANRIGRITTAGVITDLPVTTASSAPEGITSDGVSGVWFAEHGGNQIARISATNQEIIEFPVVSSSAQPTAITAGPSSTMWFTEPGVNRVAKIGTALGATGEFTSLTPARIFDTRDGTGGHLGKLGPGAQVDVQVTGAGGVIPSSNVDAVVVNATVTGPTAASFLTVFPTGAAQRPFISNLNYLAGQTVPNLVTVELGSGGKITLYNDAGSTDVILDVVGFYATSTGTAGSRFHPLPPVRDFDTRDGTGGVGSTPLGPAGVLHFKVTGAGGVPNSSGVTGVVLNVTVTQATAPSFLTVYPDDVARPVASNLNYVGGQTVPNLVAVRVPPSGIVDFYNNAGTAHVLADVVGYYDGDTSSEAGRFVPGTPFRAFDSRVLSPFPAPGCLTAGGTLILSGAPAGVGAVVANVTVTQPTSAGYLTAFPNPPPAPLASNLNFVPGQTVPNLAFVRVGTGGAVDFFNSAGCTHVVIDLFGFFTDSTFYAASDGAGPPPFSALRLTAGSLTGP